MGDWFEIVFYIAAAVAALPVYIVVQRTKRPVLTSFVFILVGAALILAAFNWSIVWLGVVGGIPALGGLGFLYYEYAEPGGKRDKDDTADDTSAS
jgi:hypothetical protein